MESGIVWAFVSHWSGSPYLWRIDFTQDPQALLKRLLDAHHEALIVIKAFETVGRKQAEIEQRYQGFHKHGRWYGPMPALKRFVEEEVTCETLEAKRLFDFESNGRLVWRPARVSIERRLEQATLEEGLPRFVCNARTFVLWAINDIATSGMSCSSKSIVHHPSNNGVYKRKTIYNNLASLIEAGLVVKTRLKEVMLSDDGQQEIDQLEEQWEALQKKRTKSLRLS